MKSSDKNSAEKKGAPSKKKHLFDDLSAVQVVATALAAVTSMLLSSYIGIAGSVIGVAVASVVSTLAASLYKRFLRESADKIKELPMVNKHHTLDNLLNGGEDADETGAEASKAEGATDTENDSSTLDQAEQSIDQSFEESETEAIPLSMLEIGGASISVPEGGTPDASAESEGEDVSTPSETQSEQPPTKETTADDETAKDAEAVKHIGEPAIRKKAMYGLIVVCIISALLAVAATASIIYIATMGDGIGAKPQTILVSPTKQDSSSASSNNTASATSSSSSASSSSSSSSSSAAENTENGATNTSEGENTSSEGNTASGEPQAPSTDSGDENQGGSGDTDNTNTSEGGTSSSEDGSGS